MIRALKMSGSIHRLMMAPQLAAYAAGLAVIGLIAASPAGAQTQGGRDECGPYRSAVTFSKTDAVPRELLKDWQVALPCLVQVIRDLKPRIQSVEDVVEHKGLLKTAKAVRVILDENGPSGIELFRKSDDLDVITTLSFAARSADFDFRLNATLILGNIVDNTTVCVPLDHLFDDKINVNGRVNLLAVVNVVVPWAVIENIANIEKTLSHLKDQLSKQFSSGQFEQIPDTMRKIANLEERVAWRRGELTNKPATATNLLAQCNRYNMRWAKGVLQY